MRVNLYPAPVPSRLGSIPSGDAGVRATLKAMAGLVKQYKTDAGINTLALQITHGVASYDKAGEITALQHFVRDRITYRQDVEGVETLRTPVKTLQVAAGDCDDKSVLLDTLLATIGFKVMFFAIGLNGQPFSHVLAGVRVGTRTIPLETIVPGAEPGWMPPATSVFPWNV